MAPKTRNQTPSTPAHSKEDGKPDLSSVVTPDKPIATSTAPDSAPIPKKPRKRSVKQTTDDTEDRKLPAASKEHTLKNTKNSEGTEKNDTPSVPAKKIKSKPRTKKHEKQEIAKFTQLYKEIEASQPVVPMNQGIIMPQMNSFAPLPRKCKAYTFGTFDGCVILSVYAFMSTVYPAYTGNIKQQIENNEELKKSLHIRAMVNKRDDHNPFAYWKQQLPIRVEDEGRIRYKYWPIYVRFFENIENNTEKNRKKWASSFVLVANDLAPHNVDGTRVRYSPVNLEYAGDMGISHLSRYLTVGDVFTEIERRWVNDRVGTPEEISAFRFTKVLNNDDLLTVFFGEDEDFLKQVKKFYADTRGLVPTSISKDMNDSSESEDDTDDSNDSDDDNDENGNDGRETIDDHQKEQEDGDESEHQEDDGNHEERKKEGEARQNKDRNNMVHNEQTKELVGESPDETTQRNMSKMFKSVDRSM
jgi:hypothetical protein